MNNYCEVVNVQNVKLKFNGDELSPNETIAFYELEEDDMVSVSLV